MLKKIDTITEWIANWILVITGIAVCALIFIGAVMRYVLHTDFYGSEELILVAAFWLYFIGSAMAAKHDTQIKAEMLGMFIKNPKILKAADIMKYAINLVMAAVASVWSVQYVIWNINMNVRSNVFRFPVVYAVLPIAVSFIAWTIYCIRDLVNGIKSFKRTIMGSNGGEK
jgi:TRAP-type C4-dicarboxylate transport system permease small subunit